MFSKFFNNKKISYTKLPKKVILIDPHETASQQIIDHLRIKFNLEIINYFKTPNYDYNENVDLIILCNKTFFIKINDPIILTEAELFHSKKIFSENVFESALLAINDCEKRYGK
ncbi:hypothetical protein CDIK_2316 [Cucumispora dikerogammari]|nr:hypothetical protein CDIK_2316 [Cucumispora dikerogammari]